MALVPAIQPDDDNVEFLRRILLSLLVLLLLLLLLLFLSLFFNELLPAVVVAFLFWFVVVVDDNNNADDDVAAATDGDVIVGELMLFVINGKLATDDLIGGVDELTVDNAVPGWSMPDKYNEDRRLILDVVDNDRCMTGIVFSKSNRNQIQPSSSSKNIIEIQSKIEQTNKKTRR